ncbi:MAG: peptidoglycan DD-metalloendopeptidase family protein [Odoribacter sp.]|nr:peptidoglycan DD-metalloendopeptidase family protein [Odoribacter sp.]
MKKKTQIIISSLLGILLLVVIFMPKKWNEPVVLDEVEIINSLQVEEIIYKYGIPVKDYNIDYGIVKKNQSLSVILGQHGLKSAQIHTLTEKSKDIFDVRKIRVGQAYAFFSKNDSLETPEFFVYEIDPRSYVVYDLRDEYNVTLGHHPTEWVKKEVKGSIQSSLWNAMVGCEADPVLAVELSTIFGWSIDFFGLRKGDEFKIIYEQEYIEERPLSNFSITAAVFNHGDSLYYAIPFLQDDEVLYYNENGNSLEGAFLKAPLDYIRITSRFNPSRMHPILKVRRPHYGVDYAAPPGTPVYAIGSGTVIEKGYQRGGAGNYVKIKHNGTYTTSYMHLKGFAKGLKVGSKVKQKEVIGYVGSTGLSTGNHLDFRVFENGKPVDPLKIKSQPKKPISEANMSEFAVVRDSLINRLQNI